MKVLKFGGTSVGSAQRMREVADLVTGSDRKIVVLSAMSGTTNSLVEIANYLYKKNYDGANEVINRLERGYLDTVAQLFKKEEFKHKGLELVKSHFDYVKSFTKDVFTVFEEKSVLAQGELLTTALFNFFLQENGHNSVLLPALDFMRTNKNNEPDTVYIRENLERIMSEFEDTHLFITQGYICRNAFGEVDNLQRGGSDYTASLIGAALEVEEIQIWTDIDGMHNNDPRFVENTTSIAEISFDEAAELAYFGAKILHPTSVLPAKLANVPVKVLNTMDPKAVGTTISSSQHKDRITAVAAKDGITAIKIKSGRMLLAFGFLRKVFEIFESYKTPIDMITTSEVGVSVTIDNNRHLEEILDDLRKFSTVEVDYDQVIVCVVGDLVAENKGYANRIFEALKEIPIRMISYGGSEHNISLLVDAKDKKDALQALSAKLF
ncbi:aspartate kinase [Marinilabilia salmonicolor]|jgi:aspartate kinase|uniref:Aspartokinase n=1 Tax=Marinilabilia salmonicolor TaxID=989 RepID=A0A2T0XNS6_9BACT|nr:aspartate kinase [Marinilabilia salmonicolor]PRZ00590.1 aspartate kinase [Marinilabilia salmonicolor]RCW29315.1 aspartate kinase [Marinilabilia salmonicolor]